MTNQWSNSKPHFLEMRKEGLVDYTPGNDTRITRFNLYYPYGSEINSNWYNITIKGLMLLDELFPDRDEVKETMRQFVTGVFQDDDHYRKEVGYRL